MKTKDIVIGEEYVSTRSQTGVTNARRVRIVAVNQPRRKTGYSRGGLRGRGQAEDGVVVEYLDSKGELVPEWIMRRSSYLYPNPIMPQNVKKLWAAWELSVEKRSAQRDEWVELNDIEEERLKKVVLAANLSIGEEWFKVIRRGGGRPVIAMEDIPRVLAEGVAGEIT